MKKNIFGIAIVLLLAGLLIYNNFLSGNEQAGPNEINVTGDSSVDGEMITSPNHSVLEAGDKAPNFSLQSLKGDTITLSEIDSDWIFVNFWATWCKPCLEEMPAIEKFASRNKQEVKVLAVNATSEETNKKKIVPYVEEGGYSFTVLLDEKGQAYEDYTIIGLPSSFFIDAKTMEIKKVIRGPLTLKQMEKIVEDLS